MPGFSTVESQKAALRTVALARRAAVAPEEAAQASRAAAGNFLAAVTIPVSGIVAAYWPIRDELDSRPLLEALRAKGCCTALPMVTGAAEPLLFRSWQLGDPLDLARFNTRVPPATAPLVDPHIVVAPLVGFDRRGTRLGYGGGFYDRTLAALSKPPLFVGYAYGVQELTIIERGPHDIALDLVVTDRGVIQFTP